MPMIKQRSEIIKNKKLSMCDRMINRTMRGFSLQAICILLICSQLECISIIGDRVEGKASLWIMFGYKTAPSYCPIP